MNNGKNGWILRVLVGFLLTTLSAVMFLIGNNVIANDKDSRNRDEKIELKQEAILIKQQVVNEKTAVTLEGMLVHLEYIRKKVEKIG